jgi:hypothetical protein
LKIAACLGVKDEVELIRAAVDHLRSIGVDHIIASDANSTDGTEVILAEMAKGPGFEVALFEDLHATDATEEAATAYIFARARAIGADWLLFCDADEFALPKTGQLRDVAALAGADALIIPRYNLPLLQSGLRLPQSGPKSQPQNILVYAPDEAGIATQSRVRTNNDAPWIAAIPSPKLMVRPDRIRSTAEAHHNIIAADGERVTTAVPKDLFIAHAPFSTVGRFARKIANIRILVEANGDQWGPNSAWHWKRWLENVDHRGGGAAELARNLVTPSELAELRRLGIIKTAVEVWDRAT